LKVINKIIIPKTKNTSAILFITIAFNAALLAKILLNQKLINRKDAKPTPSQPINNCKKLSDVTNINMKNVKKDK